MVGYNVVSRFAGPLSGSVRAVWVHPHHIACFSDTTQASPAKVLGIKGEPVEASYGINHVNHGGTEVKDDLHLPIDEGNIDFAATLYELRAAGYGGGFSFEFQPEFVEQGRDAICEVWSAQD